MQKKLIALAIAGLSGAAFAQSNVTIYGVADASFESVSASGASTIGTAATNGNSYASRTRLATNSSLIGFKGAEALGNGMNAIWQVENQISLDGNALLTNTQSMGNGWNTRDTYVGLTGSGGTFLAGYISTPQRSTAAKFDLMPGATGSGSSLNIIGRVNTGAVYAAAAGGAVANTFGTTTAAALGLTAASSNIGTIFRSQAIAYVSPSFGGFNGAIAYVPNENRDNVAAAGLAKRNPGGWNVAANYDQGPLAVSLTYLKLTDIGALPAAVASNTGAAFSGKENHKNWILGAKYNVGQGTTVSFMYDNFKGALGLAGGSDATIKRNNYYLGVKQDFGNSNLVFTYMKAGDNKVGGVAAAAGRDFGNDGASFVSLRYGYNFTKRTTLYGIYTKVTNKANGNYDFSGIDQALPSGTGGGNGVINAGADPQVVGVGIRHTF
jgi:predicted porin